MYTQCPACQTRFRITPEQLQAAGGKVRCGECRQVFYAPDFFTNTPAAEPPHDEPDYEQLLREPPIEDIAIAAEQLSTVAAISEAEQTSSQAEHSTPPTSSLEPEKAHDSLDIDLGELFGTPLTEEDKPAAEEASEPANAATTEPFDQVTTRKEDYGEEDIEALLSPVPLPNGLGETSNDPQKTRELLSSGLQANVDPANGSQLAESRTAPPSSPTPTAQPTIPSPLSIMLETADEASPRHLLAGLVWGLGSLLLIITLGLQLVYLNRHGLIKHEAWRPVLEQLCHYTSCTLPAQRDLTALAILERDIRSHEHYQGALTIHATVQNLAPFAQPYPIIEITMRGLDGKVVATRRFHPQEYISADPAKLFPPKAIVQLSLDIVDPDTTAVGFEFTFH